MVFIINNVCFYFSGSRVPSWIGEPVNIRIYILIMFPHGGPRYLVFYNPAIMSFVLVNGPRSQAGGPRSFTRIVENLSIILSI